MAKIKGWKRTNEHLGKNRMVYSNSYCGCWLGIGKNKRGSWTVMTPTGLQPNPFPNKDEALQFAYKYMRSHPNG